MVLLEITTPVAIGIGLAGGLVVGGAVAWFLASKQKSKSEAEAEREAARIKEDAERIKSDAQRLLDDAERRKKDAAREAEIAAREAGAKEKDRILKEVEEHEKRIAKREETLDSKIELLDKKAEGLEKRGQELETLRKTAEKYKLDIEGLVQQEKAKLLEISNYSPERAKDELLAIIDRELVSEKQQRFDKVEKQIAEHAEEKAKWVISQAIVRLASEYTGETTTSSVPIPKDDVKGRLIGREGRNIRAFQLVTGVDLIIDDTPGVIVVSCFDSVRRETAKRTLERLIEDGRIHPGRIEEIFRICEKEMEKEIIDAGKKIQFEADVQNIDPKAQYLLGRLKYRSSYGQNVYKHTVEVAYFCGMMASELSPRLDPRLARRCGLMHDIGKAIDHEQEGGHPFVGGEFLKKIKEMPEVIEAAAGHHDNVLNHKFVYTSLAAAADAISASRPGARRESMERYVQRLQSLEAVAKGFGGVESAFAIQAGREIRVFVDNKSVNDDAAAVMARDIARKIEEELTYPGEIRVTLLRETRCVEYAR